jgi:hypothetical protein
MVGQIWYLTENGKAEMKIRSSDNSYGQVFSTMVVVGNNKHTPLIMIAMGE